MLRCSNGDWSNTKRSTCSDRPSGTLLVVGRCPRFRSYLASPGATVCRPSGTPRVVGRQPPVPLVPRFTGGYCLPSLRDSSRGWSLPPGSARASLHRGLPVCRPSGTLRVVGRCPPVPLVPRFTGGYCLPSLRDFNHWFWMSRFDGCSEGWVLVGSRF